MALPNTIGFERKNHQPGTPQCMSWDVHRCYLKTHPCSKCEEEKVMQKSFLQHLLETMLLSTVKSPRGREAKRGIALLKHTAQKRPSLSQHCHTKGCSVTHNEKWVQTASECRDTDGPRATSMAGESPNQAALPRLASRGLAWPHWLDLVREALQRAGLTLTPHGACGHFSVTARAKE